MPDANHQEEYVTANTTWTFKTDQLQSFYCDKSSIRKLITLHLQADLECFAETLLCDFQYFSYRSEVMSSLLFQALSHDKTSLISKEKFPIQTGPTCSCWLFFLLLFFLNVKASIYHTQATCVILINCSLLNAARPFQNNTLNIMAITSIESKSILNGPAKWDLWNARASKQAK